MFQKIFSVKVLKRIEEGELNQIRVQAKNAEHREILQWKKMERERKSSESENLQEKSTSEKTTDVTAERVPEIDVGNPIQRETQNSPRKKKKRKPVQKAPEKSPSEAELAILKAAENEFKEKQNEIYTAIKGNDAGKLDRIIQDFDEKDKLNKILNSPIDSENKMTFLHIAAQSNGINSIQVSTSDSYHN